MSFIDDIRSYFSNKEFYGNSGYDYLTAIVLFILSHIIFYFLKFVLIGRLKSWIKKKGLSKTAEGVLEEAQKSIGYFLILHFKKSDLVS